MMKKNRFLSGLANAGGQNMVEYMLLFVAVILVFFIAMAPNDFFRNAVSDSLNASVDGIEAMTNKIDVNRYK